MTKPDNILNHLTKDEIESLRAEIIYKQNLKKPKEKACLHCEKVSVMRNDQKYCSTRCRNLAHQEHARLLYEKLLREQAAWLLERNELIKEIAELKAQLNAK